MNDHARELRRYASVLGRPTIMLDAADEIERLAAKLEAAEKERDALRTELNEIRYGVAVAHDTIKTLRAKVEAMEQQKPVGWLLDGDFYEVRQMSLYKDNEPLPGQTALYALPGAQPAQSVPEKITSVESGFKGMFLREAKAYKQGWNECRAAMLAAAPEAKP